jgi:hypothetical protein
MRRLRQSFTPSVAGSIEGSIASPTGGSIASPTGGSIAGPITGSIARSLTVWIAVTVVSTVLPSSTGWAEALPRAAPEAVGLAPARLAQLRSLVARDVEAGRVAGAVLLVMRRGKVAWFEAARRWS